MPVRNVFSWNTMMAGYAKFRRLDLARELFDEMPERDVTSWNTIIAAYEQQGCGEEASRLFWQLICAGVRPNHFTFASVLSASAGLLDVEQGKQLHAYIIRIGFLSNMFVGSALVDTYAKCGSIDDAREVFDQMPVRDVLCWNTMIAGYSQYGNIEIAHLLFEKMPQRNEVSWNTMIAGFAQQGQAEEALGLFCQMREAGLKPDQYTLASVLSCWASLAALEHGRQGHGHIIRIGYEIKIPVQNALVAMYAKCGIIRDARRVFNNMPVRDVVSWNSLIDGCAQHGFGKEALQLFEQMQQSHINPNETTFIGILSACGHAGLVDDGWKYFDSIARNYHIMPTIDHYCCMVDLLGRAGHLHEAYHFVNKMPIKPNDAVWGSLLGACRNHSNIELGELVADNLLETNSNNAAHYVLLSNIYAAAGRWADVEKVRKLMINRKVRKTPGCSWIELNGVVYTFLVGDRSHPQTQEIYAELDRLYGQIKEAGYVPNRSLALHDVEEEQKEDMVYHHSEKLAIAFGLINTPPKASIRIIKNLRMCGECHLAIKFISKIVVRDFYLRDATRFHHFKDGKCSCRDYW